MVEKFGFAMLYYGMRAGMVTQIHEIKHSVTFYS